MKYQSIIINTQNKEIKMEEIAAILNLRLNTQFFITEYNSLLIKESKNKNSIGISDLEGISEWAYRKAGKVRYVIIFNAERLTEEAQNSLLKIIEEPPENLILILTTSNLSLILETILSRCFVFNESGNNSRKENDLKILAQEFLDSTYLERSKIIDKIVINDEMGREKINAFFVEIMAIMFERRELGKIDIIKKVHKGIKRGTNLKLTLDYLSIELESGD